MSQYRSAKSECRSILKYGSTSQNVGQAQNVGQNQNVGQQGQGAEGGYFNRGPMCFNCRQYGHYQWNCPVSRLDHSRKHLN